MTALTISFFFFFNDTATTEIYTLSLHDALPILMHFYLALVYQQTSRNDQALAEFKDALRWDHPKNFPANLDRKSTRLNSSHVRISYAVFCLKKKKKNEIIAEFGSHEGPQHRGCC